jgi:thioredoxin-like negative regulator of GroEL
LALLIALSAAGSACPAPAAVSSAAPAAAPASGGAAAPAQPSAPADDDPADRADTVDAVDAALERAQKSHVPVLVDFGAAWCYACYYMAENVLTGPEWAALQQHAVVVTLDVDTPQGRAREAAMHVNALPTYVVLDAHGVELGRIVGEQTRAEFYRTMHSILARAVSLDQLAAHVHDSAQPSAQAVREVLAAFHAQGGATEGLAWWTTLPAAVQVKLERDALVRLWTQRLRLQQSAQRHNGQLCAALAPPVFAGDLGCDRAAEVRRTMECTTALPAAQRRHLLAPQKAALARLLYGRVFVAHPSCADARTAVLTEADLDRQLGYPKAESAILRAAIDDARKRLGGDIGSNRNLADNLRVYLEKAGRTAELDALYPKLIAAYPDDYVYAYRYARMLAAHGHDAEALHYYERAAAQAYGRNRLAVAEGRVAVLLKLGRASEAQSVAAEALQANGPWFPQEAARLRRLVAPAG